MAGRFITLYTLPAPVAAEGTPVLLTKGELLMDRFTEKLFIRIEMQSLDERMIHAVRLCLQLFDEVGAPIDTAIEYRYGSLRIKRDQKFGENRTIPIQNINVRSFSAFLTNVTFSDYSFWENDLPFQGIGRLQTLEEALGSEMLSKQFEAQYGSDCHFMPSDETIIWYCACGAINRSDEERCHSCRRKRTALQNLNYEAIKSEAKNHSENKNKESQREDNKISREKIRQNIFKLIMIVVPVLLVVFLIASTVPSFIERQKSYQHAVKMLEQKQFEEAEKAFELLGDYQDSAIQASKEVPYQKAVFLIEKANKEVSVDYSDTELESVSIQDDNRNAFVLYEEAKKLLETIVPYKDAEGRLADIQSVYEAYEEKDREKNYLQALRLLEKGAYLHAREEFLKLGDYRDSVDQANECVYKRAASLLTFCENNNVRNIYLAISEDIREKTKVSMPGVVLTELGSDTVYELKKCFAEDGVEFFYEDQPSGDGYVPICKSVEIEFVNLGEYKDSAELSKKANETGDFSRAFYRLLADGHLSDAVKWLGKYGDEVPDAESYVVWLEYLQTLCNEWELAIGDSSLIPFSAGMEYTKLEYFTIMITIENDIATLHIIPSEGDYEAKLTAEFGEKQFSGNPDGTIYYGYINQVERFVYIRYMQNGVVLSSCEYTRK